MALIRKYFVHGLIVSILLGAIFSFLGAYGTTNLPYFKRFVFWTSTMVVGCFSTGLAFPWVVDRLMPLQHRFVQLFTITIIISVPVTLVLAGYDRNYAMDWSLENWLLQYVYVFVISFILVFGGYFILKAQGLIDPVGQVQTANESEQAADDVATAIKLLQRLPDSYQGAELYAVSSEDHYLRVYTDMGEELILMRLSDALKELEQVPGMQTHRSWWVARNAVVGQERQNGKKILLLKSGAQVPVSRTYEKAVKEAELGLKA